LILDDTTVVDILDYTLNYMMDYKEDRVMNCLDYIAVVGTKDYMAVVGTKDYMAVVGTKNHTAGGADTNDRTAAVADILVVKIVAMIDVVAMLVRKVLDNYFADCSLLNLLYKKHLNNLTTTIFNFTLIIILPS